MLVVKIFSCTLLLFFGLQSWSQKKAAIKLVNVTDSLEDVSIQPNEALSIAEPYLKEHATDLWNPDKPLETYIVLKGRYYYVSKSNYPAKTLNYYLQPAIKVNTKSGHIQFVKK